MTRTRQPESYTKSAIKQLFQLHGWAVMNFWQGPMSTPGVPDLLAISPPKLYPYPVYLWIEVKRPPSSRNPGGHVRKAQKEWIGNLQRSHHIHAVVASDASSLASIADGSAGTSGLSDLEVLPATIPHLPGR